MKIDVIGAGAIGMLCAVKLKSAGHEVRLWCRTKEQVKQIEANGILFESRVEPKFTAQIQLDYVSVFDADHLSHMQLYNVDLTIVALKQSSFDDLFLSQLKIYNSKINDNVYLFMQNGIGHLDKVRTMLDEHRVIQAVTSEAALKIEKGVAHTGYGITYLAEHKKRSEKTKKVEECLNKAGIRCSVSKTINEYVYNKLIINAVINPLTALYKVNNGELPLHSARRKLMEHLYLEAKEVIEQASQIEIKLTFDDILDVCKKTSLNQSSMLADVLNGRLTEIESINGAIVKLANKHQMKAPINETVTLLILAQHP